MTAKRKQFTAQFKFKKAVPPDPLNLDLSAPRPSDLAVFGVQLFLGAGVQSANS